MNNHALKGNLRNLRSINVNPDIRIVFESIEDYIIVSFLDIGSHSQLYG